MTYFARKHFLYLAAKENVMTCSKCGEKLALFSNFCENCGAQGPSAKGWWKFIGSSAASFFKRRIWLTIVVAAVLVFSVGFGIWHSATHNLVLTDFVTTSSTGYNGNGSIRVEIDYEALCEKVLGKVPDSSTAKGYEKYTTYIEQKEALLDSLYVSADRTTRMKNDDFYTVTIRVLDSAVFKELGYDLKEDTYQKTFQVGKDCPTFDIPENINLFDYIELNYHGNDVDGYVVFSDEAQSITLVLESGESVEMSIQCRESWIGYVCYVSFPKTNEGVSIQLQVDKSTSLSNGDIITVTLDEDDVAELNTLGIVLEITERTYQVTGLE